MQQDPFALLKPQYEKQDQWRVAEGRATIEDAAKTIAANCGAQDALSVEKRTAMVLRKLKGFALSKVLKTYAPGSRLTIVYGRGNYESPVVREYYDEVYLDDLNELIPKIDKRFSFRFRKPG